MTVESNVESTTTETAAPEVSPAPETTGGSSPEGESSETPPAPPSYALNPVYKVKNLEKKFDDFILPAIKDAQTEAKVRELYEKAHGLDFVKQDRQSLKERLQNTEQALQTKYIPLEQSVNRLINFKNQKDYDSFFAMAQIPPQEVLQWALRYAQATPEQRSLAEQRRQESFRAMSLEEQNQQMQQHYAQQAAEYRSREIDFVMSRQDVTQIAQEFDARNGIGSFRNEVIRRGQFYALQGKDIPAEQAVMEVLGLLGRAPQAQPSPQVIPAAQSQGSPVPSPQAAAPVAPEAKPVIPNISGRGTSPAKKVIRSLKEMKELGRSLA